MAEPPFESRFIISKTMFLTNILVCLSLELKCTKDIYSLPLKTAPFLARGMKRL